MEKKDQIVPLRRTAQSLVADVKVENVVADTASGRDIDLGSAGMNTYE